MIIQTSAYGRAGLIGNPSDGYFGKTIAVILRNFSAHVVCFESPRLNIAPCQQDQMTFSSLDALADDVQQYGYYGGLRLVKASIKRFGDYCREAAIGLEQRNFTLEYRSNIPVRVGLAGSSAIVTATLRALMTFYEVDIPPHLLAKLALGVELQELGIGAGLQDRVVQAYEGVVYMDFDRDVMEQRGYGHYEELAAENLPPLFVAYHPQLSEGTEVTHNDLRSRFNRGDSQVLHGMEQLAELAQSARDKIIHGRGSQIGPLLTENFELRKQLITVGEGNRKLVTTAEQLGCHAKLAGSGGAVIGVYDGDPARYEQLRVAYGQLGAKIIHPIVKQRGEAG